MFASVQLGYQISLAALIVIVGLQGSNRMRRTAVIILAVMGASYLLAPLWPSAGYAWAMIAVDSAALVGITWRPAGKWQAIVGLSYILQVGTHGGRIIVGEGADIISYWWGLSIIAILQLLLLGGWLLHDKLADHRGNSRSAPHFADSGS